MSVPATGSSPIADISYRTYDGPLRRRLRWWIVALAGIRIGFSRWYLWVFMALAMLPYLAGGFWINLQTMQTRVMQQAAQADPMAAMSMPMPDNPPYALHFFQAAAGQAWWVLGLALTIGAASIAADTRANALLVYLSKPLTRLDYLFGKWLGIFLMLYLVSVVPALLLYFYCLFSFANEGFFQKEPYLIAQIFAAALVPAVFHASALIGCSAWSRSGRIAGATYAGAYFLANAINLILWLSLHRGVPNKGVLLRAMSIQGMIAGLQQNIFNATVRFGGMSRRRGSMVNLEIPPPDWHVVLPIAIGICIAAIWLAWTRIRAVEVVRG